MLDQITNAAPSGPNDTLSTRLGPEFAGECIPAPAGEEGRDIIHGVVLKRSWTGEVRNVSLLVAISVNDSGYMVPQLRQQTFETAIIDRYWRCETSVEEACVSDMSDSLGVKVPCVT